MACVKVNQATSVCIETARLWESKEFGVVLKAWLLCCRLLLMEKPRPWLVVCPGPVQRPQRVWEAVGDHADPHTGQLHGGHQLWVLVRRPALQREETDTVRGLHVDQRALLQLIVLGRPLPKWPVRLLSVSQLDLGRYSPGWCKTGMARQSQHSGMIQMWLDAGVSFFFFFLDKKIFVRESHFFPHVTLGAKKKKKKLLKSIKQRQWISRSSVALRVHVLVVILASFTLFP